MLETISSKQLNYIVIIDINLEHVLHCAKPVFKANMWLYNPCHERIPIPSIQAHQIQQYFYFMIAGILFMSNKQSSSLRRI